MRVTLSIIIFIFLYTSCNNSPEEPTEEYVNFNGYYFDYTSLSAELPPSLVDSSGSFKINIHRQTFHKAGKELIEKQRRAL